MINWLKKLMLFTLIDISHLVKKADYVARIVEIEKKIPGHNKYSTTNYFNKFSGVIFAETLKRAKLATIIDLCTFEQCAQGIIQKKSASGNWMLPLVIFHKKVPFFQKVVLF